MTAYYNENDPFAAAWLHNLISEGLIAYGEVDTRDVANVHPKDVRGYRQCHFFAGIGGWSYALRLAGWPDDRVAWTGSCPCQPFSAAGRRQGIADKRHLWPELQRLVAKCRPSVIFGEQVASKDGRLWLAGVRTNLETLGYGIGAADMCAAGIAAPHIRQRLFWVARAIPTGRPKRRSRTGDRPAAWSCDVNKRLAKPNERQFDRGRKAGSGGKELADGGGLDNISDAVSQRRRECAGEYFNQRFPWAASVFVPCSDGKLRRIPVNEAGEPESTLFPLAHGISHRVGTLRGAGNAIVPQVAAEFIRAYLDI